MQVQKALEGFLLDFWRMRGQWRAAWAPATEK